MPAAAAVEASFGAAEPIGLLVKESRIGLMVVHVKAGSAAARQGVRVGDVVVRFDGRAVPAATTEVPPINNSRSCSSIRRNGAWAFRACAAHA